MSQMASTPAHISVLLDEVLASLGDLDGKLVVDGTFGAGGYTRAFLERGAQVIGFDRDARVKPYVDGVLADFPDRFRWINRPFSEMAEGLADLEVAAVDAVVLDIGVSSMQLDEAERGFSFMRDGPLDMRMSVNGRSAADIVNEDTAEEIAHVIWLYGEERKSRGIAAAIVRRRAEQKFERTLDLAEVVERALGGRRGAPVHPATRTFQGLRIAVNDELGELERALEVSETVIKTGGILSVVTFHSLEDRIVKNFFAERCGKLPSGSRYAPEIKAANDPTYVLVTHKAQGPSAAELSRNPRSRSAKLRAAQRTSAPTWLEQTERAQTVSDKPSSKKVRS